MESVSCVHSYPQLPLLSQRSPQLFLMWETSYHQPALLDNFILTGLALNSLKIHHVFTWEKNSGSL